MPCGTDAGKEWQGIPELTEKYGFVWKRKNVTLTGHGAMARLDRTVRTLRYYMEMLWLASGRKENNWSKLFKMAVWVHNNSSHQFSDLPPQYLVCNPAEMAEVRQNDYKKYPNYRYMRPYYSIEDIDEYGPMVIGNDEKYYVEVQKENPGRRFRYHPLMKAPDRHLYSTRPRELKFVVGNKFILRGDKINIEIEPDERERVGMTTITVPSQF